MKSTSRPETSSICSTARSETDVGISFRPEKAKLLRENLLEFEIIEFLPEHYTEGDTFTRRAIRELSDACPADVHGLSLSLGTVEPPDRAKLARLKEFIHMVGGNRFSEHIAFMNAGSIAVGQLMPVPRVQEAVETLVRNARITSEVLEVPILLENIAYVFEYENQEYSELEFVLAVLRESGASFLLDVENLRINAANHHYDAHAFIRSLPSGIVDGVHVAGGKARGDLWLDTHDQRVSEATLELLSTVLQLQNPKTIILERDQAMHSFHEVLDDIQRIKEVRDASQ